MKVGILLVACLAMVQAAVIGIDFGSEFFKVRFSQVSLIRPGKKLVIVENPQSKRMTPTLVGFTKEARVFGEDAASAMIKNPKNVLSFLGNLLGVPYNNTQILQRYSDEFIPLDISTDEDRLSFTVKYNDYAYQIEEPVAMILEFIKKLAVQMGAGQVKDCSVTIPSYWTVTQRKAIANAVEAAQLNLISLIHENTAAAFYYSIDRLDNETDHHAIFYNLGASDLEVSLVKYKAVNKTATRNSNKLIESVEVLAHASDPFIGGKTFDSVIAKQMMEEFATKYGADPKESPKAQARFVKQANIIKKVLSASKITPINMSNVFKGHDFISNFERDSLDKWIETFRERLIAPVNRVLEQAQIEKQQIDTFEIIGGVVRVPKVQEILREELGFDLGVHLNGDEAMAHGSAIFAANFTSDIQVKPIWLTDIHPYEITAEFFDPDNPEFSKKTAAFKANGKLSAKKKVSFTYDGEVICRLSAIYGEETRAIGEYTISGVKDVVEKYQQKPNLVFTFLMNSSGVPALKAVEANVEVEYTEKKRKKKAKKEKKEGEKEETEEVQEKQDTQEDEEGGEKQVKEEEPVIEDQQVNQEEVQDTGNEESAETESNEEQAEGQQEQTETENSNEGDNYTSQNEAGDEQQENSENQEKESQESTEQQTEERDEDKYEYITKMKVETTKLKLKFLELDYPRSLTKEKIKEMQSHLQALTSEDEERVKTAEAKNDLESYIYSTKDKLEDDEFGPTTSDEQKIEMKAELEILQEWMESSEFEQAKSPEVRSKKRRLADLLKDSQERLEEYEKRKKDLGSAMEKLEELMGKIAFLKEEYTWVAESERESAFNFVNETLTWAQEKVKEQEALQLHEAPAFKMAAFQSKVTQAERKVKKISKAPKPKEEKAEEESAQETPSEEASQEGSQEEVNEEKSEGFSKQELEDMVKQLNEEIAKENEERKKEMRGDLQQGKQQIITKL